MGREIKRVALDFDWPMYVPWKGYMNPYSPINCKVCKGSGLNPATKKLEDDWYTHSNTEKKEGWQTQLEQGEVDALVSAGRLMDFTRRPINDKQREDLKKAKGYWLPYDNGYKPTAEEVNVWAKRGGLGGHDAINRWICVEARAKRLGVYGKCSLCNGYGHYWCEDKYEKRYENWKQIEPPEGEGWQVWETVSDGSPVTPVFTTADALIEYLVANGDAWDQHRGDGGWSRESAENFVKNTGWAPSLVVSLGKVQSGHEGIIP